MKHCKADELTQSHKNLHPDYEYYKKDFIPRGYADKTMVSIYEIPPGKSAYPYHYHLKNEETFYIIRGEGLLKTPQGEKAVSAGDLIFFQGTYNTSGASHVGIYVGGGMMIHCGNPISYASIETSYWQQHYYCMGRIR